MLVLSRRANEGIVFPNTGIRIRVLQLDRNVARIGIEAPPEITILRSELEPVAQVQAPTPAVNPAPASATIHAPAPASRTLDTHALRNHLNKVTLGLYRFQQYWQSGQHELANQSFEKVLDVLGELDRQWAANNPPPPPPPRKQLRILLVEDDENERELLAGILGMHGCQCDTVGDGQAALDYLASGETPDVVLLDMGLPRLTGPEMLARLRDQPIRKNVKVFVVSGQSGKDLGIDTGPGGVDAWFRKPLNPRSLWKAIQQRLDDSATSN